MRKNKQGGFTLIEMLIVVAIIAILVAVSIPMINNSLDKARVATDAANERAAKAEFIICYLNETLSDGTTPFVRSPQVYAYDASAGTLKTTGANIAPYGKCTKVHSGSGSTAVGPHTGKILYGRVSDSGVVDLTWGNPGPTTLSFYSNTHNATVD